MKYRYYHDPAHGYIAVKLTELQELGISNQITHYSYHSGQWVYLEEDGDAYTWLMAYKKHHGRLPELSHRNNGQVVRSLPRYGQSIYYTQGVQ